MNGGEPRQTRARRIGRPHASARARYDTGYGKLSRQHRFRPGQSGNPKDRPKGAKNAATLLQDIVGRKIEVRRGSTLRKMTVLEGHADTLRGICRQKPSAPPALKSAGKTFAELARIRRRMAP
jgi:hypothetical protein